jgi:hypothetical protein
LTEERTAPDAELDFYTTALARGASQEEAERIDAILTERVMRARGAL